MQEIEFHRALHRPGTIVDAGAHDGRLTLPLAQLPASRVVAFEPVPSAFARLPHVTLRREALAEHSGTTTIAAPRVNGILQEEWASISKDYAALRQADPRIEAIEAWSVPMLRLDDAGVTDVGLVRPLRPEPSQHRHGQAPPTATPRGKGDAPLVG